MEDPLVRQPSSGTIISHNAHLLLDSNDNVTNPVFNLEDGQVRPGSDSSQLSRELDASPVDEGRNSKESLDEEAQYQRELKDRVRRSYADLGMEPEGILLRDDDDEKPPQSDININEELDYGLIKTSDRDEHSDQFPSDEGRENGRQLAASDKEEAAADKLPASGEYPEEFVEDGGPFAADDNLPYGEEENDPTASTAIRENEISNNHGSNVTPHESEDAKPSSVARSRLSRQSKVYDQENPKDVVLANGGDPRAPAGEVTNSASRLADENQYISLKERQDDQLRDSLEPDHPRLVENPRDSLDDDYPEDDRRVDGGDLRNVQRDSDEEYLRDSLEDQIPQEESAHFNDGPVNGNVNNNAQYGRSPPVGSKSGRTYADVVQDQNIDDGYNELGDDEEHDREGERAGPYDSNYGYPNQQSTAPRDVQRHQEIDDYNDYNDYGNGELEDREADSPQSYHNEKYPNQQQEPVPAGAASQEDYIPPQADDYYYPSHESQGNNAAPSNRTRAPPVPPPMPPEPPPPVLSKPTTASASSRPATNPFRVGPQQGDHQSKGHTQAPQQNQDILPNRDRLPSGAQPARENGLRTPSKGSLVQATNAENNPYHAEFLNQAAIEQPLSVQNLAQSSADSQGYAAPSQDQSLVNKRAHPPPPPPVQPQTFQSHDASPHIDQSYSRVNDHVKNEPGTQNDPPVSSSRQSNSSTLQQANAQELQLSKSPLKVRESPRQTSNHSRTPLHLRPQEKSYLDQFREKQQSSSGSRHNDSPNPGRTSQRSNRVAEERPNGTATQVANASLPVRTLESQKGFQGYGRNSRGSVPKEGIPQRNDKAGGSLASLESLRFQALPRENSQTKANHQEEKLIKTLPSGEMLHVAYISDDSDDEDMHFVDEMGNPVDAHGNRLSKSPFPKSDQTPKLEYRIKPTPPKQKSTSQPASTTSSAMKRRSSANRTLSKGKELVNQTAQVPSAVGIRRQTTTDKAVGDSKAPSPETLSALRSENTQTEVPVAEEHITSSTVQREGELSGTIPDGEPMSSTPRKDHPSSSDRRRSTDIAVAPLGDVTVTSLQGQPQYGYPANVNPAVQMAYQVPQQFVASQVQPGQVVQFANQPAIISPSASYSFAPQMYAQIQPTVAMSPVQTILQPVVQPPQLYMGGPQFQPQFVAAQVQQGSHVYGAHQGQDVPNTGGTVDRGGPSQESAEVGKTSDEEDDEEDGSPQEETSGPLDSEQSGRTGKHPKGVRGLLADRNKESKPKKKAPKLGKNFIDANKNNVKNLPPDRRYKDMYINTKTAKQPLNRKQPLPNISQDEEDSGEERWAYQEDARGYEEDEEWARQLVDEQRMMAALKRNQSDSNILERQANMRRYYPDGHGPNDPRGYGVRAFSFGEKTSDGQPYSYSADRAITYARMKGPRGYPQNVSFNDDSGVPQDRGRYGPRERFAYTHPMPARYSPYEILPDIPGQEDDLRVSDPDGYLMKMRKQRQPPNYKEYTVKDYRALQRDIRLGGLGPDPDLVQERQEKAQRQREYAKAIMEQNKKTMKKPPKPWTPPKNEPPGQEKSRRGAALRYAKNVPRPPLRTPQEVLHGRLYGPARDDFGGRDGARTYVVDEIAKLDELAERHRQEKEEIERLRNGEPPRK